MIFFFLSLVDAYLNHPLLSLCDPKRIRQVLCENMNEHYKYLTYPNAKRILHEDINTIDIYGDNSETKNVEHIFPQSLFKNHEYKLKMKSDLHNLYLCNYKLNNYRSNFKYVDSAEASKFKHIDILDMKGNKLVDNKDIFTKTGYLMITNKKNKKFIPSNYSRGKISRALSYFVIKYDIVDQLSSIIDYKTLLEWSLKDPVDNEEYLRNIIIYKHQRNLNPFIMDPDLMLYSFADKVDITEDLMAKKRQSYIDPLYTIDQLINEIHNQEKTNMKNLKLISKLNNNFERVK